MKHSKDINGNWIAEQSNYGLRRDEGSPDNARYSSNFGNDARTYREDTGDRGQRISNRDSQRYYGNLSDNYNQLRMDSIPSGFYGRRFHDDRGQDFFNRNPGTANNHVYGNLYGRHHGKGPRNYKRSDQRIAEEVHNLLTADPFIDASEIVVDVKKGEVILGGTVKKRSQKRRTEDIIEPVLGVTNVENRIRVSSDVALTPDNRRDLNFIEE